MPYTRSSKPSLNEGLMDLREVLRALKDGATSFKDLRALKKDLRRAERDERWFLRRRIVPVEGLRSRRSIPPIEGLNTQGTGAIPVTNTKKKNRDMGTIRHMIVVAFI